MVNEPSTIRPSKLTLDMLKPTVTSPVPKSVKAIHFDLEIEN